MSREVTKPGRAIAPATDAAWRFLETFVHSERADELLAAALPLLLQSTQAEHVALVQARHGNWLVLASAGAQRPMPFSLLAEALDRETAVSAPPWLVTPLGSGAGLSELLVWHEGIHPGSNAVLAEAARVWASALQTALGNVRLRERQRQRIERLETILKIGIEWIQSTETGTLLQQVAEASTRFLQAERASIFLWDRQHHQLIARPALGVAGGELRLADNVGVVGSVVQTGQPRRVDQDEDQRAIDRRVDKQLGFQTRSLLCVPLVASGGRILGAFEMINKIGGNFTEDDQTALTELAKQATIALENTQQYEQLLRVRNQIADQAAATVQLIGDCPAIEALRGTVSRIADTDLAVLILGEHGTGKEVVAQLMHYLSRRRHNPFVAVNCAAITESLLESELFGHEKGAFTDAHEARAGKFEQANSGTLFLDEIGDMSLGGQAKLLRVLEEKVVVRVGGSMPISIDTRVIAATNQPLAELVRQKRFREDLYFRLNVVTLDIPPLRDRGEDILRLAEYFLRDFCGKARRKPPHFTAAALKRLRAHAWPGNVRELRNLMERLAYLSAGESIDADELAFILSPKSDMPPHCELGHTLSDATRTFQIDYIQRHIDQLRGNMTAVAERLGLHRSNLYRKMRQLEMHAPADGEAAEGASPASTG
jgi:transcriptional regulator with GAF, ATPase, and Fis domain